MEGTSAMPPYIQKSKNQSNKIKIICAVFFVLLIGLFGLGSKFIPKVSAPSFLISPVDKVTKLAIAENIWLPKSKVLGVEDIPLTAKAAFFIDGESGRVIYEKNSHLKLPIASLTKIMTVIIALEHKQFSDIMAVPEQATNVDPDKMYLKPGEKLTLEELLDGIFLASANDAAETVAKDTTGSRKEFINLMNLKAKQIGMNDTLFINPTGLEEDDPSGNGLSKPQYSTAYDVALMARYAIVHWPHLLDISSQPQITLPPTPTHSLYTLENGINLITTYPGVVGFKIGYTPDAGLTIVTVAKKDGKEVLGVLLDCTDRRDDTRRMLDYSFKKLGVES